MGGKKRPDQVGRRAAGMGVRVDHETRDGDPWQRYVGDLGWRENHSDLSHFIGTVLYPIPWKEAEHCVKIS